MTPMSVVTVTVSVQQGAQERQVQVAGAFDPIRTADAARAAGRSIGELVADNLERRIRHGESLS